MVVTAWFVTAIFLFLSAVHIYWAFGGTWSNTVVIPTRATNDALLFEPSMLATLSVAFALLMAALVVLVQAEILILPIPDWIGNSGSWVLVVVFGLRAIGDFRYVGFFKRVRDTKFAEMDTRFYSPLCVMIALLTALTALT